MYREQFPMFISIWPKLDLGRFYIHILNLIPYLNKQKNILESRMTFSANFMYFLASCKNGQEREQTMNLMARSSGLVNKHKILFILHNMMIQVGGE